MDKRVWRMLREIGAAKVMLIILLLRAPFDFLNAILTANMLERFVRIAELGEKEKLLGTFLTFLLLSALLFAYNMTVWMTISVNGTVAMHQKFRRKMLGVILSKEYGEIEKRSNGDWITRLGADIDRTCDYLVAPVNFMHLFIAAVSFLGSSLILIRMNAPLFAIAMAVMIPFFLLGTIVMTRNVPKYKKRAMGKLAEYTNWVEPVLASQVTIRVYEGEEFVLKKVEEVSRDILRENMKAHLRISGSSLCNIFSGNLGYLLLLFVGNSMMGEEIQDFAMLSKITQYRGEMMRDVMIASSCLGNMRTNLAGVSRVSEVLEERG